MLYRYAMTNIISAHKGYWFSADTMRFFKTRLSDWALTTDGDPYKDEAKTLYFITTEKNRTSPRRATIRAYNVERDTIETIGEFQQYPTRASAERALAHMLGEA